MVVKRTSKKKNRIPLNERPEPVLLRPKQAGFRKDKDKTENYISEYY